MVYDPVMNSLAIIPHVNNPNLFGLPLLAYPKVVSHLVGDLL